MTSFRLRRFSKPSVLESISPARLHELLEPYQAWLAERGCSPATTRKPPAYDLQQLATVLATPCDRAPAVLLDALYLIDEMSDTMGSQALEEALAQHGIRLANRQQLTAADLAVEVWLCHRELLIQKHAERRSARLRSFEYYQSVGVPDPHYSGPGAAELRHLERGLSVAFAARGRGDQVQLTVIRRRQGFWLLVRRGEQRRREPCWHGPRAGAVVYHPARFDTVGYRPALGELCVNAATAWAKDLYRREVGRHLFGSDTQFPVGNNKYTLEPLWREPAATLECQDIPALETVRLVQLQFVCGLAEDMLLGTFQAEDLLPVLQRDLLPLPVSGRLVRATFRVKFRAGRGVRSVVIRPSNMAQFVRDDDGQVVDEWLTRRGLVVSGGNERQAGNKALACA